MTYLDVLRPSNAQVASNSSKDVLDVGNAEVFQPRMRAKSILLLCSEMSSFIPSFVCMTTLTFFDIGTSTSWTDSHTFVSSPSRPRSVYCLANV
jgi:hypothetical protein